MFISSNIFLKFQSSSLFSGTQKHMMNLLIPESKEPFARTLPSVYFDPVFVEVHFQH